MTILDLKNLSYDYITKAGAVHALKEATASFETGKTYKDIADEGLQPVLNDYLYV